MELNLFVSQSKYITLLNQQKCPLWLANYYATECLIFIFLPKLWLSVNTKMLQLGEVCKQRRDMNVSFLQAKVEIVFHTTQKHKTELNFTTAIQKQKLTAKPKIWTLHSSCVCLTCAETE